MSSIANVSLSLSPKQVFNLAQKLDQKNKVKLIRILEQQQYLENIPETHKKIVRQRIKNYTNQTEDLVDERTALTRINVM